MREQHLVCILHKLIALLQAAAATRHCCSRIRIVCNTMYIADANQIFELYRCDRVRIEYE